MEILKKIFMFAGILFLVYGIVVLSLIGMGNFFNFFYLCAGLFLILLSLCIDKIDPAAGRILVVIILIFFVFFLSVEIRIITYAQRSPEKDADYLIVLGSQMKADGPSIDYQARLDRAYEYLSENRNTKVITTGAQGDFEPVSEARGGADHLIGKGIDESRIIIEDGSYNTLQNLSNAMKLIEKDGKDPKEVKTVIVSAVYHLYRASYIAEKIGLGNVSCSGGRGLFILLPHYFTREFFGLLKEWIVL